MKEAQTPNTPEFVCHWAQKGIVCNFINSTCKRNHLGVIPPINDEDLPEKVCNAKCNDRYDGCDL